MNRRARVTRANIVARSDKDFSEQFRTIAELRGDIAWIVDCASGLPTYISPAVETLLGYQFHDFLHQFGGKSSDEALFALCAGLPARLQRFADGDHSRMRVVRSFEQRHRDGRMIPIEVISTLVLDDSGAAGALVGVLRDCSEEREQQAGQRRFASMLNHEFRTPLSTIDGAVQRLEVTGATHDEPTRQRYRKIQTAVDRLIGMLDEYLSPERMEAIGRKRQPDSLDPRILLEEGAAQARAAGRPVTLALGELPPALRCEPAGLRLALKVLVENAILYSPPGTPIGLSGQRADGGVTLLVSDQGGGVPEGELESIFGKHTRGSNAAGHPGSGLGLYMARSVIEVHGGSLSAANMADRGTVFKIFLPAQRGAGKCVASSEPSSDNSHNQHIG